MREFYCHEGHHWVTVHKGQTMRGARKEHAEEHTAERVLFTSPELLELDAQLEGWYG